MAKADLHLHSQYSDYPSTWLHKLYDSPESFTSTETVYQQAKVRGMDFVTITDHDDIRGSLELVANHPDDCFVSCEVTAYFPEDGCKVHILVYDIDEEQYSQLMVLRRDLYKLSDYIRAEDIANSVAHASYDQDGKLTFAHIEKLVLLFNVFEIRNGASSEQSNELLAGFLRKLTASDLAVLGKKHQLETTGEQPWIKGFTGGSDDHCGLLIGTTFTRADVDNKQAFIEHLKKGRTTAGGLHGTFQAYTLGVFKHLHDYQLHNNHKYSKTKAFLVYEQLFHGYRGNWLERLKNSYSLRYLKRKNSGTHKALFRLLKDIDSTQSVDIAEKIPLLYERTTELHDSLCKSVLKGFTKHLPNGNLFKVFNNLNQLLPALAMSIPFIGSLRHQVLKQHIKHGLTGQPQGSKSRRLWFVDITENDRFALEQIRNISAESAYLGYDLKLVVSSQSARLKDQLPENTLFLDCVMDIELPGFDEDAKVGWPSILATLEQIDQQNPDEIIVSTPGPCGWIGLLCAKLLDVPSKGLYPADLSTQVARTLQDPQVSSVIDVAIDYFYHQFNTVYATTPAILYRFNDGKATKQATPLPTGINTDQYRLLSTTEQTALLPLLSHLTGSYSLLHLDNCNEESNQFVADLFAQLIDTEIDVNLIICSSSNNAITAQLMRYDGKNWQCHIKEPDQLAAICSFSDVLIAPGKLPLLETQMLTVQACGLPVVAEHTIIGQSLWPISANSGVQALPSGSPQLWYECIVAAYKTKLKPGSDWQVSRHQIAQRIQRQHSWRQVLSLLYGDACPLTAQDHLQSLDLHEQTTGEPANAFV